MSFIGIISKPNKLKYIEKIINLNKTENTDIIFINNSNICNMKNIKFETILIIGNINEIKNINILKKIISCTKYLIIQLDSNENIDILKDLKLNVVTFGFNQKSTITVSSVEEENIILCLQRSIKTLANNIIEPQEINIKVENEEYDIDSIIGITSMFLVHDIRKIKV